MKHTVIWLRLEGGLVLVAATLAYSSHANWSKLWFVLLLLFPDISMLGYLFGAKTGQTVYNLGHSYLVPAAVGALALISHTDILLQASLIWLAHIGFDRSLGYGLKIGPSFKDTHLGVIGRK